jgi:hypothetical protein
MTTQADMARARAASCRARAQGCARSAGPLLSLIRIGDTPERRAGAAVDVELSNARSDTWNSAAVEFEALATELDAAGATLAQAEPVRAEREGIAPGLVKHLRETMTMAWDSAIGGDHLYDRKAEMGTLTRRLAVALRALGHPEPDAEHLGRSNRASEQTLDPDGPTMLEAKAADARERAIPDDADRCRSTHRNGYRCRREVGHTGGHVSPAGVAAWGPDEHGGTYPYGEPVQLAIEATIKANLDDAPDATPVKTPLAAAVAEARRLLRSAADYTVRAHGELTHQGGADVSEALEAARCAGLDIQAARETLEPFKHLRRMRQPCRSTSPSGATCEQLEGHPGKHACSTSSVNGLVLQWEGDAS